MTHTMKIGLVPTISLAAVVLVTALSGAPALAALADDADHPAATEGPAPTEGAAGEQPTGGHGESGHGGEEVRDYEAVWDAASDKEHAGATELIDASETAGKRWHDVEAALADGFVSRSGRYGAVHYPNFANRRDDLALDPEHPEGLVYLQRPNGAPILLGILYTVSRVQERPTPAGDLAAWHVHNAPGCHHPDVDAGCDDVRGGMLHVWVYDGVVDPFADPMSASMGSREAWRSRLFDLAGIDRPKTRATTDQASGSGRQL